MASTISAGTTSGTAIAIAGDTTGNLAFTTQAGANTITVPNSTGTILTTGSPQSGGVIQVVQTVKTSTFTTSSAMPTFADVTGLSATITPKFATSKILVTVTGVMGSVTNGYAMAVNLIRGSTSIAIGDSRGSTTRCFGGGTCSIADGRSLTVCFLDSPATTSATTYKVQLAAETGGTAIIGGCANDTQSYHFSTPTIITLQEIAA
jgi:hypothetical protein